MNSSSAARDAQLAHAEHEIMFHLMKELRRTVNDNGETAELRLRLASWCREHFLSEEYLMRQHGYPETNGHAAEHARMVGSIAGLSGLAEVDALLDLMVTHVREVDSRLHVWLDSLPAGA